MTEIVDLGAPAPDFTLATDTGSVTLSAQTGKPVVVYFYPKDDTPGCTKEAIGFSCAKDEFDALGAVIIGISTDTAAKHGKFRSKHELKVELGADEDHSVADRYGVWVEKSNYGKTYMGIERSTFLVGRDGKIARVWRKVKVDGHVEAVLQAVKELA
ncbi:thioredoxin-dependent thiol peroxidase [Oryzibacter oryziterrae]|uniref:thioredoxin-dependent thiol peroxidase n=1 Tax=Oryzibacter oryziterrae TaxID=2766474 RepID=UPI001F02A559|nr:thioredoxin-dependent thiol peroxidase [Oryzibacter oryziterrae]